MTTTLQKTTILSVLFILLIGANSQAQSPYNKLCLDGIAKENNNDLIGAKINYTQAISIKPEEMKAYEYRGKVSYRLNEYNDAIQDLTKAISLSPKNITAINVRALSYMKLEQNANAIVDFNVLLLNLPKKNPLYNKSLTRRAYAYYRNKQYTEAIADYSSYINAELIASKQPSDFYYRQRGLCYFQLEKYNEALADFDFVMKSSPSDDLMVYYTGWAYFKKGDIDNAKQKAKEYLSRSPLLRQYFPEGKELDIYSYTQNKKNITETFIELKEAINNVKITPSQNLRNIEYQDIYTRLQGLYVRIIPAQAEDNSLKDSIKSYMFIVFAELPVKPTINEEARKLVVQANNATEEKNYQTAISLYWKSLEMEPCNPLAYYNLALLNERIEKYDYAIAVMKKYLKLYPDAKDARQAQDKIYEWEAKVTAPKADKDPELLNTYSGPKEENDAHFVMSYGLTQPKGDGALFNPNETPLSRYFTSGKLGIQNGFYVETGVEGIIKEGDSKFNFLLGLLFRYRQNELDWSSAGGMFAYPSTYTKDLRIMEMTEKLGVDFSPKQYLHFSAYYAPAAIFTLETEFRSKTGEFEETTYIISGGTYVRISHTLGFNVRYRFFSVGYEYDYLPMKYDFSEYYHDNTEANLTGYVNTTTGKTKLKFGTVRFSLYF